MDVEDGGGIGEASEWWEGRERVWLVGFGEEGVADHVEGSNGGGLSRVERVIMGGEGGVAGEGEGVSREVGSEGGGE